MGKSRQQFEDTIKSLSDQSEFELKLKRANNGLNYADHFVDIMWIAKKGIGKAITILYLNADRN